MLNQINFYRTNQIDSMSLQGSLEFLFQAMEIVTMEFEKEFIDNIAVLASINAGIPPGVIIDTKQLIDDALANIEKLIHDKLDAE